MGRLVGEMEMRYAYLVVSSNSSAEIHLLQNMLMGKEKICLSKQYWINTHFHGPLYAIFIACTGKNNNLFLVHIPNEIRIQVILIWKDISMTWLKVTGNKKNCPLGFQMYYNQSNFYWQCRRNYLTMLMEFMKFMTRDWERGFLGWARNIHNTRRKIISTYSACHSENVVI